MTDTTPLEAAITNTLATHDYALQMSSGGICACGFVPTAIPASLKTQQEYHREHLAAEISRSLSARTQSEWGIRFTNGNIFNEGSERAALSMAELDETYEPVTREVTRVESVSSDWVTIKSAEASS